MVNSIAMWSIIIQTELMYQGRIWGEKGVEMPDLPFAVRF